MVNLYSSSNWYKVNLGKLQLLLDYVYLPNVPFTVFRLTRIAVSNVVVKVDAHYIKGMLNNLDIVPSMSINRWILLILTFHFTLVHVPGSNHGPDGLL